MTGFNINDIPCPVCLVPSGAKCESTWVHEWVGPAGYHAERLAEFVAQNTSRKAPTALGTTDTGEVRVRPRKMKIRALKLREGDVIRCNPPLRVAVISRQSLRVTVSDGQRVMTYLGGEQVGVTRDSAIAVGVSEAELQLLDELVGSPRNDGKPVNHVQSLTHSRSPVCASPARDVPPSEKQR